MTRTEVKDWCNSVIMKCGQFRLQLGKLAKVAATDVNEMTFHTAAAAHNKTIIHSIRIISQYAVVLHIS